jgi:transcription elongation GreA/GreB family factor
MDLEALIQLAGSGNVSTVEEEWMNMLEADDLSVERLSEYGPLLTELQNKDKTSEAEALAWSAVEALTEQDRQAEALAVACQYLLALNKSTELRDQVADLYRQVYAEHEGLETLLEEAGVVGGRPVRRALRTMDVCLALSEGSYLAERHDGGAARVDAINKEEWTFTLTTPGGKARLKAVLLADRFEAADARDFLVMQHFDREGLVRLLDDDAVFVIRQICRRKGGAINSEDLEATLVPRILDDSDWKRWWTKARAALKRSPEFKLSGRSPYTITLLDASHSWEDEMLASFKGMHDPLDRLRRVEQYVSDSKSIGHKPSTEALAKCYRQLAEQARRSERRKEPEALLHWLVVRRVGEMAGLGDAVGPLLTFLSSRDELTESFQAITDNALLVLACDSLKQARPEDWKAILADLLPVLPLAGCDKTAGMLIEAGFDQQAFEAIIQKIMGEPVEHDEALLWLWDGPSNVDVISPPPLLTILGRVLTALEEVRREGRVSKAVGRRISQRSRALLSARGYERFEQCLESMERGVAMALRTQISRLDNLGRSVPHELNKRINERFPPTRIEPEIQPWEREDVLYATPAGMTRRQREIDEHVNVKMKQNAIAIGQAAAHGDLSENSEYKFALEERDLLQARLAQMNAEMAIAQVLSEADIPTDHVGIGSHVVMKHLDDDSRYEVTIVGPWEADVDEGLINYQTPLAQRILGRRIGDIVEFDYRAAKGRYEVIELSAHLAQPPSES